MKRGTAGVIAGLLPALTTFLIWLNTGAHTHFFTVDQKRIETIDPVTALTGYRYEPVWQPGLLFLFIGVGASLLALALLPLLLRFTRKGRSKMTPPGADDEVRLD